MWRGRRCGRASSWSARRWSSCGSSAPQAAATRSWFRGSPRSGREQILKYVQTDWNRLRVCRSALVETWPMLGLTADTLVWELKNIYNFSCCKLTSFLQIRKNGQPKVQNFASEIDINKNKIQFLCLLFTIILSCFFVDISDFVK